jgi:hypothetical protein
MTKRMRTQFDIWVCRDTNDLLHVVRMMRYFNSLDYLVHMNGSLACWPWVTGQRCLGGDWRGNKLPPFTHRVPVGRGDDITLIEYWVREAPTCVRCVVSLFRYPALL